MYAVVFTYLYLDRTPQSLADERERMIFVRVVGRNWLRYYKKTYW